MSTDTKLREFKKYYQNILISGTHQDFVDAVQHETAYRQRLTQYLAENDHVPDEDSAAMIAQMEAVADMFSSVCTSIFGTNQPIQTATKAAPTSIAATQHNHPTQAELLRLCDVRNTAFFAYMDALYPAKSEDEFSDFTFDLDHTQLYAIDELTKPYRNASTQLKRNLVEIANDLDKALAAQRTWLDFIIESIIPSFVLKAMHYVNFQSLMQEEVRSLSQEYKDVAAHLDTITEMFQNDWQAKFPGISIPCDLKHANSTTLSRYIHRIEHADLTSAYIEYNKNKTVSTLLRLYRLSLQMAHQTVQEEDHILTGQLEGIIHQLEQLHPDRQADLSRESKIVAQEMALFDKYANYQCANPQSSSARFLSELSEKYMTFLKAKTTDHFQDLYQHMHSHRQYKHLSLFAETRALLKSLYPQAYQAARQHHVTHIDEDACDTFLKKHRSLNHDLPICNSMLAFMREPTHEKLRELKEVITQTKTHELYLDAYFSEIIAEFMEICAQMKVNTVEDCSSDQSSDCAEEPTSPSSDAKSMSIDSSEGEPVPTLSMANLAAQNRRFDRMAQSSVSTSSHGLFASAQCSQHIKTEAQHMLKEYQAYQAEIQTQLDAVIEKISILNNTKTTGITASLQIMVSYLFHPVMAMMNLIMSNCKTTETIEVLSEKRNTLRNEAYVLQTQFEATWQEKFGTTVPKHFLAQTDVSDSDMTPLMA